MAYTTLGYDFIKSFKNESLVDKITFEDGSDFLPSYFQFNWKTGFLFKIPQSPVSLGLTYTFSKINVPIDWYGDKIVKLESIPDWSFRIENNYSHEYSFHRLGIVLYLSHKKDETYW